MKRYQAYKASGVEWIGEIPEHWHAGQLKRIVDDRRRITYGIVQPGEFDPNGRYMVRGQDYSNGWMKPESIFKVSDAIESPYARARLKEGDILYTIVGAGVGNLALVPRWLDEANITQTTARIAIHSEKADSLFCYYYLQSNLGKYQLELYVKGAAQPGLNLSHLNIFWFPIPPVKEQQIIARHLNNKTAQLDTLIRKKGKLIELLQEERTAIINQAVTKGLDPDVPMKDSGIEWLGEIPEHWEVKKIKHVTVKIGSGVTPRGGAEVYQDSGFPLLRSQNVYFDGFKLDDVAYISEEIHNSMSGSKVYASDVLINITGGSIGRCYYVTNEFEEANVNQHVCIVRPNSKIETKYLYNLLRSSVGQLQIDICQIGGNRESLNFEQIKNFYIPLPSTQEQREILTIVNKREIEINSIIAKTQQEIELLKEYQTALISEVVTGKVDVRNEVLN